MAPGLAETSHQCGPLVLLRMAFLLNVLSIILPQLFVKKEGKMQYIHLVTIMKNERKPIFMKSLPDYLVNG